MNFWRWELGYIQVVSNSSQFSKFWSVILSQVYGNIGEISLVPFDLIEIFIIFFYLLFERSPRKQGPGNEDASGDAWTEQASKYSSCTSILNVGDRSREGALPLSNRASTSTAPPSQTLSRTETTATETQSAKSAASTGPATPVLVPPEVREYLHSSKPRMTPWLMIRVGTISQWGRRTG